MITVTHKGDFKNTQRMLESMKKKNARAILEKYGKRGVDALRNNTPVDSGTTAESWGYEIHQSKGRYELVWTNSNVNNVVSIAIIIQYGHGTRNGGYVSGINYINPALSKIFDQMADEVWREVTGK